MDSAQTQDWNDEFSVWYKPAYRAVYQSLQRFRNSDLALDCTQESLLKAYEQGAATFEHDYAAFRRWTACTARRKLIDRLRREKTAIKHMRGVHQKCEQKDADHSDDLIQQLLACLQELNDWERKLLEWTYDDNLTSEQIARIHYPSISEDELSAKAQQIRRKRIAAQVKLRKLLLKRIKGDDFLELDLARLFPSRTRRILPRDTQVHLSHS